MILDVGCGGGVYATIPRGDVNLSMDWPDRKIPNFVYADAHNLPFRSNAFDNVIAFNILEHVQNPRKCLREMVRVGHEVTVRQDTWLNLANYSTPEHLWFQRRNLNFLPYPRTRIGIAISKLLRFTFTKGIPRLPRHHQLGRLLQPFLPPNQQYELVLRK